jgi:hypothetical protein
MSKPHLQIDDVEPIRAGRLTGLKSRSDLALERELKRHNLTQAWFDAQVTEQQNLCAECHQPETKRNKYRGQILHLHIDATESGHRLICQKCASKIRSAKARAKKEAATPKPETYVFKQLKFWNANQEQLKQSDPAELQRLWERHCDIRVLFDAMRGYYECPANELDKDNTIQITEEVLDEVKTCGTINLLIGGSYIDQHTKESRTPGTAEYIYGRYGFITKLPEMCPYGFSTRDFIQKFAFDVVKELYPSPVTIVNCSTPGCANSYAHDYTKAQYLPPRWFCLSCTEIRRKRAVEAMSRINNQRLNDQRADSLKTHDKWGREKIYGEDGPYRRPNSPHIS